MHLRRYSHAAPGPVRRQIDFPAHMPAVFREVPSTRPHSWMQTGCRTLLWKSNGGARPATIWSELMRRHRARQSVATSLLVPNQAWEAGVVEAPDLVEIAGATSSSSRGTTGTPPNYAVGVTTCSGPLGPCNRPSSQPILASDSYMQGPGGESVFTDTSGSFWMAFHAWIPGAVGVSPQ